MDPTAALSLNLLLRGGTVALLALIAAALWRGHRTQLAARLGAAFAIGIAAATLAAMPSFGSAPTAGRAVVIALAAGSMFVFWLFTRALLDDDFRPCAWHLVAWAVLAGVGALNCLIVVPRRLPVAHALGLFMGLMPVVWALLAIGQSMASWREDLVEGRRHLRTLIVAATALYTVAQLIAALASGQDLRTVVESPLNAAGTAALTLFVAWRMLQLRAGELFAALTPAVRAQVVATAVPRLEAPDARQVATLERLMTVERVYREPSLTIAALATRIGLPEHRLRKLINQALGHRNFNAFLNAWRIEDAKRALRDEALADAPVLTIAMDAGFQSLGPFNRAFKARTGITPTEYRRGARPRESQVPASTLAETETA